MKRIYCFYNNDVEVFFNNIYLEYEMTFTMLGDQFEKTEKDKKTRISHIRRLFFKSFFLVWFKTRQNTNNIFRL